MKILKKLLAKPYILIFLLVFAPIGGYIIINSFAAAATGTYFARMPSASSGLPRDNNYCTSLISANPWEPRGGTVNPETSIYNDSSHPKPWTTGNSPANAHFPTSGSVVPWSDVGNTESGTAWSAKKAKVDGRYTTSSTTASTTTTSGLPSVTMSVADTPMTTDQILRWVSCKWGLDENILRAQAVQETDWQAYIPGDCKDTSTTGAPWNTNTCQSYSILQIKDHNSSPVGNSAHFGYGGWPYTQTSTSLGADFYAMHLRSCFDGDSWVQQVGGWPGGTMAQYIAANEADNAYWGCIGQWFSGSWYDTAATDYINSVKQWLANKTWLGYTSAVFDSTLPTVSITSPTGGGVSGTVSLTATADDNMGVAGVQFKLDGANLGAEVAPTVGSNSYTYSWNTTGLSSSSHTLTAVARDGNGNTKTSVTVSVTGGGTGDTTPPSVNITAPANNATVFGVNTITASASDNIGVAGVTFKVDGTTIGSEDTTSPYSISWDATALANGPHTITALARDAAGNTNTSSASITVALFFESFDNIICGTDLWGEASYYLSGSCTPTNWVGDANDSYFYTVNDTDKNGNPIKVGTTKDVVSVTNSREERWYTQQTWSEPNVKVSADVKPLAYATNAPDWFPYDAVNHPQGNNVQSYSAFTFYVRRAKNVNASSFYGLSPYNYNHERVIEKKCVAPTLSGGTKSYFESGPIDGQQYRYYNFGSVKNITDPTFNQWHQMAVTAENQSDGSVHLTVYVDGVVVQTADDHPGDTACPPLTSGGFGWRSDDHGYSLDNFKLTTISGTSTCSTTPGDITGDNHVTIADISALMSVYGQPSYTGCADLDNNHAANLQDFTIVLQHYGS